MNKKMHIVLDLDHTLISSVYKTEYIPDAKLKKNKLFWKRIKGDFITFERPYLQNFLDYLFENFYVSIWTAGTELYAIDIIEEFILKPGRELKWVFSYDVGNLCEKSGFGPKNFKFLISKGYDLSNAIMIDDSQQVYNSMPTTTIMAKPWNVMNKSCIHDKWLKTLKETFKVKIFNTYLKC